MFEITNKSLLYVKLHDLLNSIVLLFLPLLGERGVMGPAGPPGQPIDRAMHPGPPGDKGPPGDQGQKG